MASVDPTVDSLTPVKYGKQPKQTAETAYNREVVAATVRYDVEKGIESGDKLAMLTGEGDQFGIATVVDVETAQAVDALDVIEDREAQYAIESDSELISKLNDYYGEDTTAIFPHTKVKIIFYRVDELTEDQPDSGATTSFSDTEA